MEQTPGWSRGEKAGAVLLALLAVALGFIAADILAGGGLLKKNCCAEDEGETVDS